MEQPQVAPKRGRRNKWLAIACAIAVVVVLVVVIVPCAVILPKRNRGALRSNVLVPLYIYPVPGAWDPLYDAITTHPELNFTLVLNPHDGPGLTEYPEDGYITGIQKLNTYPNVRTIGYVRTTYATRNITAVIEDVSHYSDWASNPDANIAVHGIFFDEAPYEYTAEIAEYLNTIDQAVKSATGIQSNKTVIHNPGTTPDSRLEGVNTDITIILEDGYQSYKDNRQAQLASLPLDRSRYSIVLHSIPGDEAESGFKGLIKKLSHQAEYLFLTDLDKDYYSSFGSSWSKFIDAMPEK